MEERNDIVIYKSEDGLVMMEAMVDPANETIWANQKAIAALFGVTVPNISYHLGRIFKSGELEADTVVKEFLITALLQYVPHPLPEHDSGEDCEGRTMA